MINEQKKKRPVKRPAPKKPQPKAAPAQEVVYTPAPPLNYRRLILRLVSVVAVAAALFMGCTVFFRVKDVAVTGTQRYTPWSIREASGIEKGAGLLTFGKTKAAGRIMENLRYIKSVRIGVTLPDTVNIYIEELEVVYGIQDENGGWWLMSADGRVVERSDETKARETTVLKGLRLASPVAGESAVAAEPEQTEGSTPVLVTERERLEAALKVVTQLERCEILGEAASVDVIDPANIQLWYGEDYQVLLGNPERMDEKIMMMDSVIKQHKSEGGYQSGVLDITLTNSPNSVEYTPFG